MIFAVRHRLAFHHSTKNFWKINGLLDITCLFAKSSPRVFLSVMFPLCRGLFFACVRLLSVVKLRANTVGASSTVKRFKFTRAIFMV